MSIDFGKILKRAWHILWNYKVLWIFGILLALFASSGGFGSGSSYQFNSRDFRGTIPNQSSNPDVQALNHWFQHHFFPLFTHPGQYVGTWILIGLAILVFILIVGLIVAIVRYPSEAAVIRMVDGYEASGAKLRFGAGWKLGWNHRAFRMWWINFLIEDLPTLVLVAAIIALGAGTFFAIVSGARVFGAVSSVVSVFLVILLILVFGLGLVFLRLLRQFFWRKVALEDTGTKAAFREGWAMFKRNWTKSLLMWLIMVGIKIGVGIATTILFFLFIPLYIVLAIPALVVAAIPGLIAFGIASIFLAAPWTWIIGLIVALPFFFMVAFSPLTFAYGWYKVYDSSAWTLFYRELQAFEAVSPAPLPPAAPAEPLPPADRPLPMT